MSAVPLPDTPDFAAIELAAPDYAERQQHVLMLIGHLGLHWSNNESIFIYILMLLLDTGEVEAAIIFATLNTTRARLELVRRLAAVKLTDATESHALERLIRRFENATKLRNEFNHCIYRLNERGEITHTHLMRPQAARGGLSLGEPRQLDDARVREISDAIRQLKRLNRDLWAVLPRLKAALARGSAQPAAS